MSIKTTLATVVSAAFLALASPGIADDTPKDHATTDVGVRVPKTKHSHKLLGLTPREAGMIAHEHKLLVKAEPNLQPVFRTVDDINGEIEIGEVPAEYLEVDQQMRGILNGSNLFLLAGSIYYVDKNTGKYEPGHGAYDLYFFVGSKHGDPKTRDNRIIEVKYEGKTYRGNRDRNDATRYYSAEIANAANMIESSTRQDVTNDMVRNFARLNGSVGDVDIPLDDIVVGRRTGYTAEKYFISTEDSAEGMVQDVWVLCEGMGDSCPDANGRQIPYVSEDSQAVPLEGAVLRHLLIVGHEEGENYKHADNPEKDGHPAVLIVPRAGMPHWIGAKPIKAEPVPAAGLNTELPPAPEYGDQKKPEGVDDDPYGDEPAQPKPEPTCKPCAPQKECPPQIDCPPYEPPKPNPPVPLPQCNDGIDNDNNGDIDFPADKGCSSLEDMTESSKKPRDDLGKKRRVGSVEAEAEEKPSDAANPDMYVGIGGDYEYAFGHMVPGRHLGGGHLVIGGYLGEKKKVGFGVRLKGLYAGESTEADDRNRELAPNPADPEGLGSKVEGYTHKKAGIAAIAPELRLELSENVELNFFVGPALIIESQTETRRESLTYQNGDEALVNSDRDERMDYRAAGTGGIGLNICTKGKKDEEGQFCVNPSVESTFNGDGATVGGALDFIYRIEF